MQEDFEYDALTIRPPQRTRWYTHLWPACLGCGCLGRRRQRFPLYLIGYHPVGRFQRAASVGDVASVEWFINASEHHVNECDRRGRSSLHYASAHNHPNVVTLLSSNDCTDINLKYDEGCTPLIKATQRDNIECISILLRHGADPHIVDANGDAALHNAICRGNIKIFSKLLEYNVDIKARTVYGLTPYKLALFENHHAMAEFLIENGVDADSELTPNREPQGTWEMETGDCLERYTLGSLAFTAVNNKKLCLKTKLGVEEQLEWNQNNQRESVSPSTKVRITPTAPTTPEENKEE
ncbi:ankyrin repeat domain-containing protein 7-like [Arvicola amphibius]|uniref:ankyrin repeat domain-containing protein 7-like n=1 Tax=Arvicola amphibius TaxID=1047088 RepID=UPI001C0A19A6|nr:ankyrin repeat domain-containing protein 7-like [Arvicola amphibius]